MKLSVLLLSFGYWIPLLAFIFMVLVPFQVVSEEEAHALMPLLGPVLLIICYVAAAATFQKFSRSK